MMAGQLPLVVLIHGVNSSGEWHDTTIAECRGIFDCQPIKYRYYHGNSGPLKVYIWPTGALLFIACLFVATALYRSFSHAMACWIVLVGMLMLDAILVALAEIAWSKSPRFVVPFLYLLVGIASVLILVDDARIAALLAAIAATSFYLDFREYGAAATLASVGSVLVFGAVASGTQWALAQKSMVPFLYAMGTLFVLTILEPWVRRTIAFHEVDKRIRLAWQTNRFPPHVVAHSLGTYLTGHLVNESRDLVLGRVVFTGCVLEISFPWRRILGPDARGACWGVKNFVGEDDFVPILTGIVRDLWIHATRFARGRRLGRGTAWLGRHLRWRPLGRAGQQGFAVDHPVVHSVAVDRLCPDCLRAGEHAPVHNIAERFAGHSTLNGEPGYQLFHWLPYLWGSSPENYALWKEICLDGSKAYEGLKKPSPDIITRQRIELQNDLLAAETHLLHGPWYWPNNSLERKRLVPGRPLRAYVEETLAGFPRGTAVPSADAIMNRLPVAIFAKVAAALAEKNEPDPLPEIVALLEPRLALFAAMCDAINAEAEGNLPRAEPTT